ncbi:ATP-grasp domain-containing protein [Cellulosimicrobium cellulans]|uniref:ATP-grasp domain-containing protein n=1 Tax=Cellulosimicrobium cellulans TaxID=1710 RepID=UPI0024057A80|nr:ATP-grasp domain-containing protein [Cellulosimicrobium cellulans]MDF9875175.1 carbamoylphosphate synthase large subunit [Cellulosimicrobium cellulans]
MTPTVLLTGAAGPAGRSLLTQLRSRGVAVVAVDADPARGARPGPVKDTAGGAPSAVGAGFQVKQVPLARDLAFLPEVERIARVTGTDLVIPTVSEELPVFAARRADEDTTPVLVGHAAAVAVADDKFATASVLHAAAVPVPAFGRPSDFASFEAARDALGGTLVVKPRVSRGGRGVQLLDAGWQGDWTRLPARSVVQRFAPGTEYAPVVYRGPSGAATVVVVLEKTELAQGAVGNAVSVRRVEEPDVADVARDAVMALDLRGPVDLDVRRDHAGVPRVLEVNARFGANSAQAPEILDAMLADLDAWRIRRRRAAS